MKKKVIMLIKRIINKIIEYKEPMKYGSRGENVWIGSKCEFGNPEKIFLDDDVYIGEKTCIYAQGEVHIHKGSILADSVDIRTANHYYDGNDLNMLPFDERVVIRPVIIRENVWIGSHCLILPGVEIGEGAVIGAGSVVTKNIPPLAVVGGAPARIIKWRNKERYYILKKKGEIYMKDYNLHMPTYVYPEFMNEGNDLEEMK